MSSKEKNLLNIFLLAIILFTSFYMFFNINLIQAVTPSGGSVIPQDGQTAPADTPQSHAAIAGNVTEMDIAGYTTTQSWQGYYGNVSGTIQLADSSDNVIYNWNLADASGEVLASTNDSLIWSTIMCFNFTASGTFASDVSNAGGTSQFGMNLTQIEAAYNILSDDVDGVNETFNLTIGGNGHDLFFLNNYQFSDTECQHTKVFADSGPTSNEYEEVLLYDSTTQSVIFTSLLEEVNTIGFDDAIHDFEMLVLEDGHGTNTATTTYYFYVELQ